MAEDAPNANEGSDPTDDIKKQSPGTTTTSDQTKSNSPDRAGAAESPDAGADGHAHDQDERSSDTKVQDLAKAGRENFNPDAGQE